MLNLAPACRITRLPGAAICRAERAEREKQFAGTYRKSALFDPEWLRGWEEFVAERDRREETDEAEMQQAEAMEHFLAKECGERPKLSKQGFINPVTCRKRGNINMVRKGYDVELSAPTGQFRVVGVDLFSHEDYLMGDYDSPSRSVQGSRRSQYKTVWINGRHLLRLRRSGHRPQGQ